MLNRMAVKAGRQTAFANVSSCGRQGAGCCAGIRAIGWIRSSWSCVAEHANGDIENASGRFSSTHPER